MTNSKPKTESFGAENTNLKEVELIQDEVKYLEEALKTLKIKMDQIYPNEEELLLSQVAYDIERYVTKTVLNPLLGPKHYITSIMDMQSAINGDKDFADLFSNSIRDKAKQSWRELQEKLEWRLDLFRYMSSLKKGRLRSAHLTVNMENAIAAMEKRY